MIDIIITSYNEPKATLRAVNTFLNQDIKEKFRIIVVDPFPEVEEFLRKHIKSHNFNFFLDPGEGKSYALNLLLQEVVMVGESLIPTLVLKTLLWFLNHVKAVLLGLKR